MQTLDPEVGLGWRQWRQAIASCDVLVAAMDVELAMLAVEVGKRVVFYGVLLWFWVKGRSGAACARS